DTKRHEIATHLWDDALKHDPKLAADRKTQHRYNAACAAALAAAGTGEGDPKPDDATRAKLRGQALGWLRAELDTWSKALDTQDPKARAVVDRILRHWQRDPDLAGVRDQAGLDRLPE